MYPSLFALIKKNENEETVDVFDGRNVHGVMQEPYRH